MFCLEANRKSWLPALANHRQAVKAEAEDPSRRAGGIHVKQLQQLFFQMPEVEQGFFRHIEHQQEDDFDSCRILRTNFC